MLKTAIREKLAGNERPSRFKQLEEEARVAIAKGYTVVDTDYENGIYIKSQAEQALKRLGVDAGSLVFFVLSTYRFFPLGAGEELHALGGIVDEADSSFWEDEYPNFYDEFLQLSSIEAEGSYFYKIDTNEVFDADWNEMDALVQGKLQPTWNTYKAFLEWYYG